jgi:hypothetical protein
MLHQLQADMKGDIQDTIESSLNTHLSPFKSAITAEISQHDDLSRATWIGQLEEILERYLGSQRLVLTPSPGPPRYTPTHSRNPSPTPTGTKYTLEMMKYDTARLQRLLIPAYEIELPPTIDGVKADMEITHRLRLWLASTKSEVLWIQGHTEAAQTNMSSLSSVAIDTVAAARAADVDVLWYICKRLDSSGNEITQTKLFVDLLISLLLQLIQCKTYSFPNDFGVGKSGFDSLDATPKSIPDALSLLKDAMADGNESRHRIVVIDSFDLLDYSGDEALENHIKSFVGMLEVPPPGTPTKTLLTTEEQTTVLLDLIGQENMVDSSQFGGWGGFIPFAEFGEMRA